MAITQLGSKALMSIVKVKENNVAQEFYVVRHSAYTTGRTLLLRRYTHSDRQWHTSNVNAYASSTLDTWFNGEYFNTLAADIRGQIAAVSIPYTPGNGSTALSSLSRKVFAVFATELGQTNTYLNAEGTSLANAATLKIATDSAGTAKVQWTRSPNASGTNGAWILNTSGGLSDISCTSTFSARPAFTLPSSLSVDDKGNVVVNTPPIINYSGSTNLGEKSEGFTVSYAITDGDNDPVTATEKMDGATKRTYIPPLGAYQQFQSVLPQNFQTVLNGSHTLNIEATDGKVAAAPVSIVFTKKVHSCSVTLSSALPTATMPKAARLAIIGSIPAEALWTAEICNNANDPAPTWENIKSSIQANRNFVFTNKVKTAADWGVNFRITMQRGSPESGGYITAIEGGFQ